MSNSARPPEPLRFATFLAPSVFPAYEAISRHVGRELGITTTLQVGRSFNDFREGGVDVGFICGLPYVRLAGQSPPPVELLAAPVLQGERYGGRPVYFSDVIVRKDAPFSSLDDLRGCVWGYNDPDSQSGYGITLATLVRRGRAGGFFGKVVETGFHQESIRLVADGNIDASAIDSQVLAVALREEPELAGRLKVIDTFGPSTIQPVVASTHLPVALRRKIAAVLTSMHNDPYVRARMDQVYFERFVPVMDSDYDDIRDMMAEAESAAYTILK